MNSDEEKNVENNKSISKIYGVVIIILLIVIVVFIIISLILYRRANPTTGEGNNNLNPYCLRITCNEGTNRSYHNVAEDPQLNTWVTLNYCTTNAPSSGLVDALYQCAENSNTDAWQYFHSSNAAEPNRTNIEVYQDWHNGKYVPNCGYGWIPYQNNTVDNNDLSPIIQLCADNV